MNVPAVLPKQSFNWHQSCMRLLNKSLNLNLAYYKGKLGINAI